MRYNGWKRYCKTYKEGFEAITPFYASFDIKPGKVAELDVDRFSKLVNNVFNNSQFTAKTILIY